MDDIDLETRLSAAVDELRPSPDLGTRVAHRVARRERHRRVARVGVSAVAGLVVVALIGAVVTINRRGGNHVIANQPQATFRWSTLPAPPIPARENPAAAWTGTEAVFWGGQTPAPSTTTCTSTGKKTSCSVGATISAGPGTIRPVRADGAAYDPAHGTWRVLPDAPIGPRSDAASVWTGTEMIVWGGWRRETTRSGPNGWADGAAYNPATNRWRLVPVAPINRVAADAVWTGREMIVLGGSSTGGAGADDAFGAAYDPAKNTWRTIPDLPAPTALSGRAIWTGDEILYWVALADSDPVTHVARPGLFSYDPQTNVWRRLSSPAPQFNLAWNEAFSGFGDGRLILAGRVMEGRESDAEAIGYDPTSDSWAKIFRGKNTGGRLLGIDGAGTAWTGRQLLLLGGFETSSLEPATGRWRPAPAPPILTYEAATADTGDGRVYIWGPDGAAALLPA